MSTASRATTSAGSLGGSSEASGSGSTRSSRGGQPRRPEHYLNKKQPKVVRILTVLAYILSVSFLGLLLSAYYIFLWEPQATIDARSKVTSDAQLASEEFHELVINDSQEVTDPYYSAPLVQIKNSTANDQLQLPLIEVKNQTQTQNRPHFRPSSTLELFSSFLNHPGRSGRSRQRSLEGHQKLQFFVKPQSIENLEFLNNFGQKSKEFEKKEREEKADLNEKRGEIEIGDFITKPYTQKQIPTPQYPYLWSSTTPIGGPATTFNNNKYKNTQNIDTRISTSIRSNSRNATKYYLSREEMKTNTNSTSSSINVSSGAHVNSISL